MESKWSRLTLKGVIFAELINNQEKRFNHIILGQLLYEALEKQDAGFKDLKEKFGVDVENVFDLCPPNIIIFKSTFLDNKNEREISYFNPEDMMKLLLKIQNGVPVPYDTLTSIAVELGLIEDTNMKEVEEDAKNIDNTAKSLPVNSKN